MIKEGKGEGDRRENDRRGRYRRERTEDRKTGIESRGGKMKEERTAFRAKEKDSFFSE